MSTDGIEYGQAFWVTLTPGTDIQTTFHFSSDTGWKIVDGTLFLYDVKITDHAEDENGNTETVRIRPNRFYGPAGWLKIDFSRD